MPKDGLLYVSMVETLVNRLKKQEWQEWYKGISLVIPDECHLQDFNKLLMNPLTREKYVLGFSATPKRTGHQRQLSEDYEDMLSKRLSIWAILYQIDTLVFLST